MINIYYLMEKYKNLCMQTFCLFNKKQKKLKLNKMVIIINILFNN